MTLLSAVLALAMVAAPGARPAAGAAAAAKNHGRPVQSIFHIAKSENKNQVHYGVKVDTQCRPKGESPVYAYWKDREKGPNVTSKILKHELPAYGLTRPRGIKLEDTGGSVKIGLRGFPDRVLTVETFRGATRCRARALTKIKKQPAILRSIYVELGFLFSIDYVVVKGLRASDGGAIQEKVDE